MQGWIEAVMSMAPFLTTGSPKKANWVRVMELGIIVGVVYATLLGFKAELKEFKADMRAQITEMKSDTKIQITELKVDIEKIRNDFYKPVVGK